PRSWQDQGQFARVAEIPLGVASPSQPDAQGDRVGVYGSAFGVADQYSGNLIHVVDLIASQAVRYAGRDAYSGGAALRRAKNLKHCAVHNQASDCALWNYYAKGAYFESGHPGVYCGHHE